MINKLKEMYKFSGYNKEFVILFTIIVSSTVLEIISIPYITRQIIDVQIPKGNIRALIVYGILYTIFILISCYLTLKHCNMRSILKRKIQRDLREKIYNKMRRDKD